MNALDYPGVRFSRIGPGTFERITRCPGCGRFQPQYHSCEDHMGDLTFIYPLADWKTSGRFKELYDLGDGLYEHPGCDGITNVGAVIGNPIRACADAKVHKVHKVGDGWGDGSFGNCVILDHVGTPYYTITAHMQALYVFEGDMVKQGDALGTVGMTGLVKGAHVHWGMDENDGFGPQRFKDLNGIMRIGSKTLIDPELFVKPVVPPLTADERLARIERVLARAVDVDGDGKADITDPEKGMVWLDNEGISLLYTQQRQNLAIQGNLKE